MRGYGWFIVLLAALVACPRPARAVSSNWDRLRQLLNNSDIADSDRQRIEEQYRRINDQRKKQQAEARKASQKTSIEAIKEAFEKGKKAYEKQLYSEAYMHFSSVASCGAKEAAKMASEAKTRVLEIEGMAQAKLKRAELLLLKGEAAEAAKAFLEVVQDFPYGDAAKSAKARLLAIKITPAVAASLRYAEGKAHEDAESYGEALKIYDEVHKRWPDEIAALRAKVAARKIRQDPEKLEIAREALELEAERKCPTIINLAMNFLINEDAATAREQLNQVIRDYPGTSYAEQAAAALEAISNRRFELAQALLEIAPAGGRDDGAKPAEGADAAP